MLPDHCHNLSSHVSRAMRRLQSLQNNTAVVHKANLASHKYSAVIEAHFHGHKAFTLLNRRRAFGK
jgi:hypothetical protein